ncbi:carbohydrate porin [Candidatus Ruminimicrobiellum ovillum]|uniref:carbohydrate porin n=1 Tax=Candidatus Ruminimicrobiellum ovillum TaxID=1947927 RepID=UPI00355AAAC2
MKKLAVAAFLAATVTLGFSNAYAAEAESLLEGLSINGGITLILQSLQKSNVSTATDGLFYETPTIGSYSVDLEIEKKFDDNNTAFLHLETGTGDANSRFTAFSGINRDADDSGNQVSVTEAWFEHKFNDAFGMTFGVIDPTSSLDDNAYANDETSQFLGDIFRNAPVISFGDNAIGLKAVYETDFIDVAAQYLNVENTVEIPGEEVNNDDITRHGFVSAQVNFKPGFIEDMEGNYRIYAWGLLDGGVKWEDGENTTDYGFGVSIDQQLSDIFGVFARYSWKRDDAVSSAISTLDGDYESPCNQTWSIGAQAKIKALGDEDIVGLAFGQMMISDKAKDAYGLDFKAEDHLEVYYSWNISDYLAVTPSIQYVNNICGGMSEEQGADNSAFVGSIRMQIGF